MFLISKRYRIFAIIAVTLCFLVFLELGLLGYSLSDLGIKFLSNKSQQQMPSVNYQLNIYHHDPSAKLMVVSKTIIDSDISQIDGPLDDFQHTLSKVDVTDYTFRLINGYDYINVPHVLTSDESYANSTFMSMLDYEANFLIHMKEFLNDLFASLEDARPSVPALDIEGHYQEALDENKYPNTKGRLPVLGGHLREQYLNDLVRTEEYLNNFFRLSHEEVDSLSGSHNKFLHAMPKNWPFELTNKYNKYNNFMKGDGIVFLVGGKYDQIALMGIKRLRSVGSKLPIEVIFPYESDYHFDYCNTILPTLGATCKVMTKYIPEKVLEKVSGFQLKSLALLVTSFENVLFLDADNIPIKNPDILFANKPFTNTGLVSWPDFWRRTAAPSYYKIAGIKVNTEKRVRNSYYKGDTRGTNPDPTQFSFHDCEGSIADPASEAGQILINRKMHFNTLLLMLYYNYYGPEYYYELLSQGQTGAGDKDTFLLAAHALKLPYYQVQEFNREFGPVNKYNHQDIHAMGQYDPIIDYIQFKNEGEVPIEVGSVGENQNNENNPFKSSKYSVHPSVPINLFDINLYGRTQEEADFRYKGKISYAKDEFDPTVNNYNYFYFKSSRISFLHVNGPKFFLQELFLNNYEGRGPKDANGNRRRLYGTHIVDHLQGYDIELEMFKDALHIFCQIPNLHITLIPAWGSDDRISICREIEAQIQFLEASSPSI